MGSDQFEDSGKTVKLRWLGEKPRDLPVLKLGKRLFAGQHLSMLNPHGYGGSVWSAMDIEQLQHNVDQGGGDGTGH